MDIDEKNKELYKRKLKRKLYEELAKFEFKEINEVFLKQVKSQLEIFLDNETLKPQYQFEAKDITTKEDKVENKLVIECELKLVKENSKALDKEVLDNILCNLYKIQ